MDSLSTKRVRMEDEPSPSLSDVHHSLVPMPVELRPLQRVVENYVQYRIKQFAGAFALRLASQLPREQLDFVVNDTLKNLPQYDAISQSLHMLRLVLRHDCQSTGCGDLGCLLCQYNPSRLCKRNLRQKYLIDDHLRAKCNAPLRVELVDESGKCVSEGLPHGEQLEVHVLNGEKYREVCPDNTLLTHDQLKQCIITHQQKALLRRENSQDEGVRVFLPLERGQAALSDLTVTTSSEALLCGKAPTFRLLVWAVDKEGNPVPHVTYVVSENFVVATKRVKHAIKSDIPSVDDHVSKLIHIGKATVDKLLDLRAAATEENLEVTLREDLVRIEKVGKFRELVELTEMDSDLKNKVRHLLKLSPEKWDEVVSHTLQAVVPDFRPRVWWCSSLKMGLMFTCKNGAVVMDHAIAIVRSGPGKTEDDEIVPIAKVEPPVFNNVPKLKAQAVSAWYAPQHPGWTIHWKDPPQSQAQEPLVPAQPPQVTPAQQAPILLHYNGLQPGAQPPPQFGSIGNAGGGLQYTPGNIAGLQQYVPLPVQQPPQYGTNTNGAHSQSKSDGTVYDNAHTPPQQGHQAEAASPPRVPKAPTGPPPSQMLPPLAHLTNTLAPCAFTSQLQNSSLQPQRAATPPGTTEGQGKPSRSVFAASDYMVQIRNAFPFLSSPGSGGAAATSSSAAAHTGDIQTTSPANQQAANAGLGPQVPTDSISAVLAAVTSVPLNNTTTADWLNGNSQGAAGTSALPSNNGFNSLSLTGLLPDSSLSFGISTLIGMTSGGLSGLNSGVLGGEASLMQTGLNGLRFQMGTPSLDIDKASSLEPA